MCLVVHSGNAFEIIAVVCARVAEMLATRVLFLNDLTLRSSGVRVVVDVC